MWLQSERTPVFTVSSDDKVHVVAMVSLRVGLGMAVDFGTRGCIPTESRAGVRHDEKTVAGD